METDKVLRLIEEAKKTYYRRGYGAGFVQGTRKREFETVEPQDIKEFIKEFEKKHQNKPEI